MDGISCRAEFGFWARSQALGQVTARGGPTSWLRTKDGLIGVVVVRKRARRLRLDRRWVLKELTEAGIPVMIWAADDPVLRPMSTIGESGPKKSTS